MTWFAIARPDGEIIEGTVRRDKMTAWRGMTDGDQGQIAGYMLGGYRCVEVQLVEPEQASALEQAFIQGAAWWEWHKEGATMWQSDRALALEEAERRTANGTLGKSPECTAPTGGAESKEDGK